MKSLSGLHGLPNKAARCALASLLRGTVVALSLGACGEGPGGKTLDAGAKNADAAKDANENSADAGARWDIVFDEEPGALVSVAGSSENDVWVVGSDAGFGPTVLHYDGNSWERPDLGLSDVDLWWVHVFAKDDVLMGGSGGTLVRYDGTSFDKQETPGRDIVFGMWGATNSDVWAVGGEPGNETSGFIWRYDGSEWRDLTPELGELEHGVFFKVWGQATDDVWIVGTSGTALHWDGESLTPVSAGTERQLLTVHGAPEGEPRFVAVGGFGDAVIVENSGGPWKSAVTVRLPQLFGVYMSGPDAGYAVGIEGAIAQRDEAGWRLLDTGIYTDRSFHSVWVDRTGGVWAAGGEVIVPPLARGMLVHQGNAVSDTVADKLKD